MGQDLGCLSFVESPTAQVEERRFIKLTDGCAVTAFDVVSVDFQLGFGVNLGMLRQQQIVISLVRVGAVRSFMDDGLAVPNAATATVEYAAVLL